VTDKLVLIVKQIDEGEDKVISRTQVEWFGMDRDDANALNLALTQGGLDMIRGVAAEKAAGKKPAEQLKDAIVVESDVVDKIPGAIR
jgi:hypothetical protein